jgi:hypothetical protein
MKQLTLKTKIRISGILVVLSGAFTMWVFLRYTNGLVLGLAIIACFFVMISGLILIVEANTEKAANNLLGAIFFSIFH